MICLRVLGIIVYPIAKDFFFSPSNKSYKIGWSHFQGKISWHYTWFLGWERQCCHAKTYATKYDINIHSGSHIFWVGAIEQEYIIFLEMHYLHYISSIWQNLICKWISMNSLISPHSYEVTVKSFFIFHLRNLGQFCCFSKAQGSIGLFPSTCSPLFLEGLVGGEIAWKDNVREGRAGREFHGGSPMVRPCWV